MADTSDPSSSPNMGDNIAGPEQTLQAAVQWTTEDFLSAQPYPVPKVTEEKVREFIEKMTPSSTKGGNTIAGGPPSSTDSAAVEEIEKLAGHAYPPPFNQHEVLVPYTNYPYCTIGKIFFNQKDPATA